MNNEKFILTPLVVVGQGKERLPNRRSKSKDDKEQENRRKQEGRKTCRKAFPWEKQEALKAIFSNQICCFYSSIHRSHFPAIFLYTCIISLQYLLSMQSLPGAAPGELPGPAKVPLWCQLSVSQRKLLTEKWLLPARTFCNTEKGITSSRCWHLMMNCGVPSAFLEQGSQMSPWVLQLVSQELRTDLSWPRPTVTTVADHKPNSTR